MKEESNVEKLSGLILKLLKVFIAFVILAVIAIIGLVIYAFVKEDKIAESKDVGVVYELNNMSYPIKTEIV